jgi:hypothetical protein
MLTDLQSSSWQEKLYSSFCVIKYLILAILGVEAIVAFLILLRLRIAWAATLNRFGVGHEDGANDDGSSKHPHALRFGEGVAPASLTSLRLTGHRMVAISCLIDGYLG